MTPNTEWHISNAHGESLIFRKRSDDPEFMTVWFKAPPNIKSLLVGAGLGVWDYDFENNGLPHRVHMDFARAVWNGLVEKAGWRVHRVEDLK